MLLAAHFNIQPSEVIELRSDCIGRWLVLITKRVSRPTVQFEQCVLSQTLEAADMVGWSCYLTNTAAGALLFESGKLQGVGGCVGRDGSSQVNVGAYKWVLRRIKEGFEVCALAVCSYCVLSSLCSHGCVLSSLCSHCVLSSQCSLPCR